ncbi:MAG: winged helix DNA-binding domain-containing protein [Trueperaceae bacterium]|nr:winged helix DNA-binding domain-containing protein [Trueperaceae bacterium]
MVSEVPISTSQLLSWRLRRNGLEPLIEGDVSEVVTRVVALRAWPADIADLSVCVRQVRPEPGALERALTSGELIRSYAFRGGSYVFTHDTAAVLLAVRATTRVWETPRFQQQADFRLDDWEPLREAVRGALATGPKTRKELSVHLSEMDALKHLTVAATGVGSDSLYKPLHW